MNKFKKWSKNIQNILSFSGGKDSTALYLLAMKQGYNFRAIFADTGHEHEWTMEYVQTIHEKTGGPVVEIIRADFSKQIERKREKIKERWGDAGVPRSRIDRALEVLVPTGIPFLDMCMWKGRFPSTKARFCTEELKILPMNFQIIFPALRKGPVVSWQGVRAQESWSRAKLNMFDWG